MVSNVVTLVAIVVAMFYLSWLVTAIALLVIPLFIVSARLVVASAAVAHRRVDAVERRDGLDDDRAVNAAGANAR